MFLQGNMTAGEGARGGEGQENGIGRGGKGRVGREKGGE